MCLLYINNNNMLHRIMYKHMFVPTAEKCIYLIISLYKNHLLFHENVQICTRNQVMLNKHI